MSGLPHARGGVSIILWLLVPYIRSSPRSWGCFQNLHPTLKCLSVFPTLVGVFPSRGCRSNQGWSLPHARGGVSTTPKCIFPCWWSSPRSWGCFRFIRQLHRPQPGLPHARGGVSHFCLRSIQRSGVFPTLVGVFPLTDETKLEAIGLPHARGGVSI